MKHQLAIEVIEINEAEALCREISAKQLKEMLHRNGFSVAKQCGTDGSKFVENKTDCILTIAKKQRV